MQCWIYQTKRFVTMTIEHLDRNVIGKTVSNNSGSFSFKFGSFYIMWNFPFRKNKWKYKVKTYPTNKNKNWLCIQRTTQTPAILTIIGIISAEKTIRHPFERSHKTVDFLNQRTTEWICKKWIWMTNQIFIWILT